MEFAINFLKSNVGIESPALLSSPFLMVVIAFFGHSRGYKISPRNRGPAALLGIDRQCQGPLFARIERNSSRSGPRDAARRRRRSRARRPPATPSGPAGHHARGTGRPQSAQRAIQDHVPGIPRRRREGLGARISPSRSIIPAVSTDCSSTTSSPRRSSRAASRRAKRTTLRIWPSLVARPTGRSATSPRPRIFLRSLSS